MPKDPRRGVGGVNFFRIYSCGSWIESDWDYRLYIGRLQITWLRPLRFRLYRKEFDHVTTER